MGEGRRGEDMTQPTKQTPQWYAANMGNDHQGLIVDEQTGRNVAVAYDKSDVHILAAAPAMYEALRMLIALDPRCHRGVTHCGECGACLGQVALAQAEGR